MVVGLQHDLSAPTVHRSSIMAYPINMTWDTLIHEQTKASRTVIQHVHLEAYNSVCVMCNPFQA